ncbi:MAG: glycosyltransferase family 4 protein [Anaerolineae bacterium]|jgi:glycosyltransferase involved in cell wall biosynthesis|nr:glycosyltransferase family 4 protein [Anaerolineae bacterium]
MRILLLNDRIPPENRGGAGEVVWRLARGLHAAGQHVEVVAATPGPAFSAIRDGIPTHHLHSHYPERWRAYLSLWNPQTAGPLRRLYERLRPDIVHAHNIHTDLGYHSLTLAHRAGIPALFTSHDVMPFAYFKMSYCVDPARPDIPPAQYRLPPLYNLRHMRLRYNPLRNVWIRHVLAQHTRLRLAPSVALCQAHAANGLPPFLPLPNGLDPDDFQASPAAVAALRDRLHLQGRRVILFAGRLTADKGTVPLLRALAQVVPAVPSAALLVLSSHPIAQQVQQPEFAPLRERHIIAGGWLAGPDLAAAFHLADVVVVPSIIFDTFPTVILEAMAAARPVLATPYGGAREAVADGHTGWIVNPFDTATFADRLTTLLLDDALRARLGAAGAARLRQQFTLRQQVAATLAWYEQARADSQQKA